MRNAFGKRSRKALGSAYDAASRCVSVAAMPCLLLALCLVLFDHPDRKNESTAAVTAANELRQHGPVITRELPLPQVTRKTHMQQAEEFSQKLVAGFGLRNAVALEFSDWILEASARQRIQPELIASLLLAESSFRKQVQSHVGAVGPAQVRPRYWGEFCGQNDLFDPEQNIYCGTQVLGLLLERCEGDRACALSAYNIGMNSKRRAAGQRYVAKIDRHMERLATLQL